MQRPTLDKRVELAAIRAGDEETRRQMRVLHEDVIGRIALLGEQINGGGLRRRAQKRPPNRRTR
jgi:hypothetical protein